MPKRDETHMRMRRTQILDASRRCLRETGMRGTFMNDVSREAGLSIGAVYTHFASKEEILFALLVENEEEIHRALQFDSEASCRRCLTEIVQRQSENRSFEQMRENFTAIITVRGNERLKARLVQNLRTAETLLTEGLETLQRQGIADGDIDVEISARLLITFISGIGMQEQLGADTPTERYLDVLNVELDRLFGGKKKPRRRRGGTGQIADSTH